MRWISYALVVGGLFAISAGLYFDHAGRGAAGTVLASAPEATATAIARSAATVTATIPAVAPPASAVELAATATASPTSPVQAEAEKVPPPAEQQTLQASAPAPTQVPPTATATLRTVPVAPTQPPALTSTPVPPPPAAPVSLGALEQQMFAAHNVERANNGVGALQIDGTLTQLARQRAQDMANKNYFAHTSPTGQTAFSLLNASGYAYTLAGENLARNNYPDNQSVSTAMSGFMASPTHRVNVLETKFSRVGIGMAVGADGMKYFAVIFAAK